MELLPLAHRRGWNARVALPGDGALRSRIEAGGLAVDRIPCGRYAPGRKTTSDFGRYIREIGPMVKTLWALTAAHGTDLLYVNGPRLLPAAAWVARARSIPLIFHCHHRICQPLAARLAGEALRWSHARLIVCCRFAGEPLAGYVAADRFHVIYNGVAGPCWTRRPRDPARPWNIGVIGRVEPEKGQLTFVSAARIISRECGNCRFIIAGAPLFSGPEYLERVRDAGRDLPVQFCGWQDDIGTVFSQLDLLVVPSSDTDSTPRVVIEAFSGGVPVVALSFRRDPRNHRGRGDRLPGSRRIARFAGRSYPFRSRDGRGVSARRLRARESRLARRVHAGSISGRSGRRDRAVFLIDKPSEEY